MNDFFMPVLQKAAELNRAPAQNLRDVHEITTQLTSHINGQRSLSTKGICSLVDRLTGFTMLVPVPIPLHLGTVLSRAVKYVEDDGGFAYDSVSRLSYIPAGATVVPQQGRLNKSGESMFYCCLNADANSAGTILSEVRAEKGQIFNMLQCRTKFETLEHGSTLNVVPLGISDYFRRGVPTPFLLHEVFREIYELLRSNLHPVAMLAMQLCDAFLTHSLSSAGSPGLFDVTSAISAECLQPNELDGILYPSTTFEGFANLVLKPNSVDRKIRYESAISVRVEEKFGYGIYQIEHLDHGVVHADKVHWTRQRRSAEA